MIIIGPHLLTGIGQHASKYVELFPGTKYYQITDDLPESENALVFLLPIGYHLERLPYIRNKVKNLACMTVCETETVHEDYGLLMKEFKKVAVPSEFCKRVLSKQFPTNEFYIIHAHIPEPPPKPYVFYHIGNILDPRKNFKFILESFIRLNNPNTRLLVKATCKQDIQLNIPNVELINGLISDEEMNKIHDRADCYVSFSSSEGVGMGAVEAAMRNKPVIITNYGGAPEYIKTPYTIECGVQELPDDDFLFKKGMIWGKPNPGQLLEFMKDVSDKNVRHMDHEHTKKLVSATSVSHEFFVNIIGAKNNDTENDGVTH
jgi:glycosyltransferase involved in cell wall biosynthesis